MLFEAVLVCVDQLAALGKLRKVCSVVGFFWMLPQSPWLNCVKVSSLHDLLYLLCFRSDPPAVWRCMYNVQFVADWTKVVTLCIAGCNLVCESVQISEQLKARYIYLYSLSLTHTHTHRIMLTVVFITQSGGNSAFVGTVFSSGLMHVCTSCECLWR